MSRRLRRSGSIVPEIVVVALCVTLSACSGGTDASDADGPIVYGADDVQVVGTSESIASVQDLEVLSDGTVWLLNSVEPLFVGFGPDGALLGSHGVEGGGPGEFGRPSSLISGGFADGVWVFDIRRHALLEISGPEASTGDLPLPRDSIPVASVRGGRSMVANVVRLASMGGSVILPRTSASLDNGLYAFRLGLLVPDLVAFDPAQGSVRLVVGLDGTLSDPSEGFELTQGGMPLWHRLWATCGPDEIRVYDRSRNEVRGFAADGTELTTVPLPPLAFTEATPRQLANAIFPLRAAEATGGVGGRLSPADSLRLMNQMLEQIDGSPEELGGYLPRYVDFGCSDEGVLWIRPYELDPPAPDEGARWLRMEPGRAFRQVTLPPRFDPYRFTGDRIWGVQRDALDVASVAWIAEPEGR